MNREIKFRAWDKGHNKMVYRVNLYSFNKDGIMDKAQLENQQVMKGIGFECEVMQFIGLKDKNGKEIYESDLVEVLVFNKRGKDTKEIARVVFKCGAFCIENENFSELLYKRCEANPLNEFFECEVIGNLYESPELLTSKSKSSNSTDH